MPSALSSPAASTSSSSLTSMRNAWKTRLAGWPALFRATPGSERSITWTSREVVSIGRLATMPSARGRAKRPSPLSANSRVSSATPRVFTRSAAVAPRERSIRMSKGPSKR